MNGRVALAFEVVAIAIIAGTVNAYANGPYTSGTTGYDVSYPNCGVTPSGAFAIVGVNGGRPFSTNGCFQAEYAAAPQSPVPSLYINTGYSGAYRKNINSACSSQSGTVTGSSAQKQAWAIGCSEADTSIQYAQRAASMWWLDVETGNSWSSSNLVLNQYTIEGVINRFAQTGLPVGVYSTASMWNTITGGSFTPPSVVVYDWVAGGSCSSPFMPSTTVWLTQTMSGGVDYDTAC